MPVAAPAGDTVLATGPLGTSVQVYDILSEIQRAPEPVRQNLVSRPDAVAQLVNNLLVRRVLAREAQRDGLAKDPVVNATLAIASDRALSDARLARMDAQNTPNDATLDAYAQGLYKANPTKFDVPAQTRVRHILMVNNGPDSLAKVKTVLDQLKSGASFDEMAKNHSIDSSNSNKGGDLGFFSAGQMVRPFEDAVNKLAKPGDLSEPVETQFGYHIIRLEERREKGRQSYEEVRSQLLTEARTTVLNEARVQKVQALSKDMAIDKSAIESFVKAQTQAR
jgi:peptidyl-prolyl cis-trans isomerase C